MDESTNSFTANHGIGDRAFSGASLRFDSISDQGETALRLNGQGNDDNGSLLLRANGMLHAAVNEKSKLIMEEKSIIADSTDSDGVVVLRSGGGLSPHFIAIDSKKDLISISAGKLLDTVIEVNRAKNTIELKCGTSSIVLERDKITINALQIEINSTGSTKVNSNLDISLNAQADVKATGLNVQLEGHVGAVVKGTATASLEASGQTVVKGAMVMIN